MTKLHRHLAACQWRGAASRPLLAMPHSPGRPVALHRARGQIKAETQRVGAISPKTDRVAAGRSRGRQPIQLIDKQRVTVASLKVASC